MEPDLNILLWQKIKQQKIKIAFLQIASDAANIIKAIQSDIKQHTQLC